MIKLCNKFKIKYKSNNKFLITVKNPKFDY